MHEMMTTLEAEQEKKWTRRQQAEARRRREINFVLVGHRTILYRRADVEKFFADRLVKAVSR